jgi:hypothetical protein
MPNIETITEAFELPEDALCLTPTGWRHERFEVIIQLQWPTTLPQVLQSIWAQHGNLLGEGNLVFKQTATAPHPKGFLVFLPS